VLPVITDKERNAVNEKLMEIEGLIIVEDSEKIPDYKKYAEKYSKLNYELRVTLL
jgi:hypothetical protein